MFPRGDASRVVEHLAQSPSDFRGAFIHLHPDMRGLYMSAYQSHLWNRILARWIGAQVSPEQLMMLNTAMGQLPVHRQLTDVQHALLSETRLPLPSARLHLPQTDPLRILIDAVLADDGITLDQMKFPGMRQMFFSKGDRAGLCMPANLHAEIAEDERHPGHKRVTLKFELPRGSYATLLVKRIAGS
jgi:tRNA pseudouridine13 synthase